MNTRATPFSLVLALLSLLLSSAAATGQVTYPQKPGEGDFIADKADVITPGDKDRIRATCTRLLNERGIPLVVVTITSMADYGASNWQIERYAMNLFDEWGIGHAARNSGILLLVSRGDRKVRIELGAGWNRDRDAIAASIVNQTIVPQFRSSKFSVGITEGVEAVASRMGGSGAAQGSPSVPAAPAAPATARRGIGSLLGPVACIVIPIGLILLVVIVKRLTRSAAGSVPGLGNSGMGMGNSGYGPAGWGGGGGGFWPGLILGQMLGGHRSSSSSTGTSTPSSSSSGLFGGGGSGGFFGGGGGGGGGSFGGGFSGGGGATGSW